MASPAAQWLREQAAFLLVLACGIAAFGYLLAERDHPVRATLAVAAVSLLAAVIRAVLPPRLVGLLQVRSRWFDTLCLAVFGVAILVVDIRLKH